MAQLNEPQPKLDSGAETDEAIHAPSPATNPGTWIQPGDYPPSSLRNEEEGTVTFTLDVDENGRVSRCVIDDPAPFPALNDVTCRMLSERARFIPAQDRDGRKVSSQYSSQVRWEIPDAGTEDTWIMQHEFDVGLTVDSDGAIIDCEVHQMDALFDDTEERGQSVEELYCEHMITTGRMIIDPDDESIYPQRFRLRTSVLPERNE
ncbi:TonB family protein [Parasphingopyxis sp. CP4]|uniref:energy transducer TonB n=1 Tax=Parasphingopyxis sp. CP4 TaxID=2724527 RepID=UPI0015A42757|nr:energy transducer TonB [Parasphingopyxis sp. CP4]QLC21238.1 TonB family protein [Parasphingopyxis sp. CP4]